MGQKFSVFAAKKWQLSLTLGSGPEPMPQADKALLVPEVGLRVVWPDQADQTNTKHPATPEQD